MSSKEGTSFTPEVQRAIASADQINESAAARARMLVSALNGNESHREKTRRTHLHECLICYHLRGPQLAGQAFRDYTCGICGNEASHSNTAVPKYCGGCCKLYELCGRCGGNLVEDGR